MDRDHADAAQQATAGVRRVSDRRVTFWRVAGESEGVPKGSHGSGPEWSPRVTECVTGRPPNWPGPSPVVGSQGLGYTARDERTVEGALAKLFQEKSPPERMRGPANGNCTIQRKCCPSRSGPARTSRTSLVNRRPSEGIRPRVPDLRLGGGTALTTF
jgi:hypothetical protein